ncbi:hypothetical protein EDB80DRAFT_690890 [Ilyonectria destructans]|nr:hypothetical protein EDB80DRAFT_690890 [Ilyonectria destructans]
MAAGVVWAAEAAEAVQAMVWCQFGRCIRSGLAANDVVNDNVGKNCSVVLEFANGYAIARHRKHKSYGNCIVISLRGESQLQLEHPDVATMQAAISQQPRRQSSVGRQVDYR